MGVIAMRILKLFLISFLSFFVLLTMVGLLFPSTVNVSRAVDLPGQQKEALIKWIKEPDFQSCWTDTTGQMKAFSVLNDSTLIWIKQEDLELTWVFHGADGAITLQALAVAHLGWLPWDRFRSLLMEPRYGPWLENNLTIFKACIERAQLAGVSP
jgi:hypothetical protein